MSATRAVTVLEQHILMPPEFTPQNIEGRPMFIRHAELP